MKREIQPEFVFVLEPGDIVHVDGVPFTYIGDGKIAGNTDPFAVRMQPNSGAAPVPLSDWNKEPSPDIHGGFNLVDGLDKVVYGPGCCTNRGLLYSGPITSKTILV